MRCGGLGRALYLLIRPDEVSTPVRAKPVQAQLERATLVQAQGERLKLHQTGTIWFSAGVFWHVFTLLAPPLRAEDLRHRTSPGVYV
jgi:hypothetical protein